MPDPSSPVVVNSTPASSQPLGGLAVSKQKSIWKGLEGNYRLQNCFARNFPAH